ncbi:adenylate kinase 1, chloroplastic-like protein [Tanacetum coccineum]
MAALTRLIKPTSIIPNLFVTRSLSTTTAVVSEIQSSANLSDEKGPGSRNFQWVFPGVPGVGKGTYASRLSNLLGVPHIVIGDLVWHELAFKGLLSIQLAEIVLIFDTKRSLNYAKYSIRVRGMVTPCMALSLRGSAVADVTTPSTGVGQRRWARRGCTNGRW